MARSYDEPRMIGGFMRPGPALIGTMAVLLGVWLLFAIAINWGGASESLFLLLCGNTERILDGEVWRLFTAPLLHAPSGTIGHIVFALLGLVFLAPGLEQQWGSRRMLRFLFFSSLIAYGLQMAIELALPAALRPKLVPDYWFGSAPVLEAVAVAWALSFRGQTVRLFFVLPITSTGLIVAIFVLSLLRVIAGSQAPEGLISPFGGMAAGWLLGGGTPSPLRRFYLKLRLAQLDREASRRPPGGKRSKRGGSFRVIEGGRSRSRDDGDDGPVLH
jgi:membrane associated rhomboid family serine protease